MDSWAKKGCSSQARLLKPSKTSRAKKAAQAKHGFLSLKHCSSEGTFLFEPSNSSWAGHGPNKTSQVKQRFSNQARFLNPRDTSRAKLKSSSQAWIFKPSETSWAKQDFSSQESVLKLSKSLRAKNGFLSQARLLKSRKASQVKQGFSS